MVPAADVTDLRINEILSSNSQTQPYDANGSDPGFEDMVEIHNPTGQSLSLKDLVLSQRVIQVEGAAEPYHYRPAGSSLVILAGSILPGGFITIFCDGENSSGLPSNELHAPFKLDQQGELVALFKREKILEETVYKLIDLVVFPRMAKDTSYGRYPDGADTFFHMPEPTFKNCPVLLGGCLTANNNEGGNIPAEIDLRPNRSTENVFDANPEPDLPLLLYAQVWEEHAAWEANWGQNAQTDLSDRNGQAISGVIGSVSIIYSVDGGVQNASVPMEMDEVQTFQLAVTDPLDPAGSRKIPDTHHSIWRGEIPGQPQGSIVRFYVEVIDAEKGEDNQDLIDTDPGTLCDQDPWCTSQEVYLDCKCPFRYQVGYSLEGVLVINEVAPWNVSIIKDTSDADQDFDDYLEIFSDTDRDLGGLWLSQNAFRPMGWMFPDGSSIGAGQHLLIWCDKNVNANRPLDGIYHTSFNLNQGGEEIFLFDTEENGFGLIDAFRFDKTDFDVAWSRIPDGDPAAPFKPKLYGSPGQPNSREFIRGDADNGGGADLADIIITLEYLFKGGPEPTCMDAADVNDTGDLDLGDPIYLLWFLYGGGNPPPDPFPNPGEDPTDDNLDC